MYYSLPMCLLQLLPVLLDEGRLQWPSLTWLLVLMCDAPFRKRWATTGRMRGGAQPVLLCVPVPDTVDDTLGIGERLDDGMVCARNI